MQLFQQNISIYLHQNKRISQYIYHNIIYNNNSQSKRKTSMIAKQQKLPQPPLKSILVHRPNRMERIRSRVSGIASSVYNYFKPYIEAKKNRTQSHDHSKIGKIASAIFGQVDYDKDKSSIMQKKKQDKQASKNNGSRIEFSQISSDESQCQVVELQKNQSLLPISSEKKFKLPSVQFKQKGPVIIRGPSRQLEKKSSLILSKNIDNNSSVARRSVQKQDNSELNYSSSKKSQSLNFQFQKQKKSENAAISGGSQIMDVSQYIKKYEVTQLNRTQQPEINTQQPQGKPRKRVKLSGQLLLKNLNEINKRKQQIYKQVKQKAPQIMKQVKKSSINKKQTTAPNKSQFRKSIDSLQARLLKMKERNNSQCRLEKQKPDYEPIKFHASNQKLNLDLDKILQIIRQKDHKKVQAPRNQQNTNPTNTLFQKNSNSIFGSAFEQNKQTKNITGSLFSGQTVSPIQFSFSNLIQPKAAQQPKDPIQKQAQQVPALQKYVPSIKLNLFNNNPQTKPVQQPQKIQQPQKKPQQKPQERSQQKQPTPQQAVAPAPPIVQPTANVAQQPKPPTENPFLKKYSPTKESLLDSVIKNINTSNSIFGNFNQKGLFGQPLPKKQQDQFSTPIKNIFQKQKQKQKQKQRQKLNQSQSNIQQNDLQDESSMLDESQQSVSKKDAFDSSPYHPSNFMSQPSQRPSSGLFGPSQLSQHGNINNLFNTQTNLGILGQLPFVDIKKSMDMFGKAPEANPPSLFSNAQPGANSQVKKSSSRTKKSSKQQRIYQ